MRSIGIRKQLLLLSLLPLLVVTAGTGFFVLYNYHIEVDILQERQALRSARLLARLATPALATGNTAQLQRLLDSAIDRDIGGASLLSADQKLIARSGEPGPDGSPSESVWWTNGTLSARWPVYRYSHTNQQPPGDAAAPMLGWIIVSSNQKSLSQYRYETITASLLWILLALLLVSFLGGNISKRLKQRIKQLRTTLSRLDSHEWSTRLQSSDNPDWQSFITVINALAQRTQQQLRHLQNQIDHSHQDLQLTLENLEISNIELELARKEALSASQSKSDFLANTSHEVRTPLTGILGFCKVLLQSERHPRKREYLETIRRSAEHLLGILNDVLDLSKIEAGKFSLDHSPFELLPVLEESVCLFAHHAADKGIELIIEALEPLPQQVTGDAARLKQLIANLVNNAVKFTDSGQVLVRLSAKATDDNHTELSIAVEDTGIGIAESEQGRLFDAFQQVDSSPTRSQGGTGLGLAIVSNLVKQMNGAISLDSKINDGARFAVTLPLESRRSITGKPQHRLKYRTALLWDHNADSRRALSHRLQTHSIAVEHLQTIAEFARHLPLPSDCQLVLSLRDETEFHDIEKLLPAGQTSILLPTLGNVLTRTDYDFVQKPVTEKRLIAPFLQSNETLPTAQSASVDNTADTAAVLVVDDNANNRLLLNVMLDDLGAPSELCGNGRDALVRCKNKHYPLIILDLQMPGMSGSEVAEAIRNTRLNASSQIVALTAHGSRDAIGSSALEHFDEFLTKPVSPETLSALLHYCQRAATPTPASTELKPVCLAECLQKSNQRAELAQRLLEKFLDGLPETAQAWHLVESARDFAQLKDVTHQLQGACAYVGAPRLHAALATLQSLLTAHSTWNEKLTGKTLAVMAEINVLIEWRDRYDLEIMFEADVPGLL